MNKYKIQNIENKDNPYNKNKLTIPGQLLFNTVSPSYPIPCIFSLQKTCSDLSGTT